MSRSTTSRPGLVLVHGAWHTPQHWSNIVSKFDTDGYQVDAPQLPSSTNTSLDEAFSKDVETVKKSICKFTDAGKDVVLVMHSYGGQVGSDAVAELMESKSIAQPGRGAVLNLFYVSAVIIEPGMHLVGDGNTPHVLHVEEGLLHNLEPYGRFYNTTPAAVAYKAIKSLNGQVANSFMAPVKYRGWADYAIPVTYMACKQDKALLYDPDLLKFISRIRDAGVKELKVYEPDCDHSPWLSVEGEFVAALTEVLQAAEQCKSAL